MKTHGVEHMLGSTYNGSVNMAVFRQIIPFTVFLIEIIINIGSVYMINGFAN